MRYVAQHLPAYCTCGAKGWLKCPACAAKEKRRVSENCSQPGGNEEGPPKPCTVEPRPCPVVRLTQADRHAAENRMGTE